MKRSKKYEKTKNYNNQDDYLKKQCYKLIDRIVEKGEIKRQELFEALAIRLNIPIHNCYIKNFNTKTLEKAVKELTFMLDL